jgi:hypothetical protein
MRKVLFCLGTIGLAAAIGAFPIAAHHAFEVDYDPSDTTDLSGVVTKVEWNNPHAHVFINVEGSEGDVANHAIELGPPYALVRGGWQRETVKIGDTIAMENVARARDGSSRAGATRQSALVLSSGERMVLR